VIGEVAAVEELLPGVGSGVADETVAVFEKLATLAGVCATKEMVAEAPMFIVPREQDTVDVPEQEPCDGVAETNVKPVGRTSVTLTVEAKLGPAFVTVIV